jgi:hypothetical protein
MRSSSDGDSWQRPSKVLPSSKRQFVNERGTKARIRRSNKRIRPLAKILRTVPNPQHCCATLQGGPRGVQPAKAETGGCMAWVRHELRRASGHDSLFCAARRRVRRQHSASRRSASWIAIRRRPHRTCYWNHFVRGCEERFRHLDAERRFRTSSFAFYVAHWTQRCGDSGTTLACPLNLGAQRDTSSAYRRCCHNDNGSSGFCFRGGYAGEGAAFGFGL